MIPSTLFIQDINGTLYVNKTPEGAAGHKRGPTRVGVYSLVKEVTITPVSTVTVEDIAPAEKAAEAPQD